MYDSIYTELNQKFKL